MTGDRCPRCDSPQPQLHPAVQCEGEVHVCPHAFHAPERKVIVLQMSGRLSALWWRVRTVRSRRAEGRRIIAAIRGGVQP